MKICASKHFSYFLNIIYIQDVDFNFVETPDRHSEKQKQDLCHKNCLICFVISFEKKISISLDDKLL